MVVAKLKVQPFDFAQGKKSKITMDKNDKIKDKETATTEIQKKHETQKFSASDNFSNSGVAREALLKEIANLKEELEECENKYKRALADYQNLEKRAAEERREWILKANKGLLLHLLPVLDTLILAEKHIKTQNQELSLSLKQFLDTLKGEGVARIDAVGKSFDPHVMECVETVEGEEGKVVEELRSGYMLHDKVLRPVLVKVGKKIQEKEEEEKAKKELQKGDYM